MERRDDCDGCDDDFESRGCKLTVTIVTTVTDRNIHRKSKIIVLKRKAGMQEEESTEPIGTWGRQHLGYIRQYKQVHYTNLLTSGKLHSYLADVDRRAAEFYFRAVTALAEQEGVTEQLKAENQMLWVQKMNNIGSRATEMVNAEIIFA